MQLQWEISEETFSSYIAVDIVIPTSFSVLFFPCVIQSCFTNTSASDQLKYRHRKLFSSFFRFSLAQNLMENLHAGRRRINITARRNQLKNMAIRTATGAHFPVISKEFPEKKTQNLLSFFCYSASVLCNLIASTFLMKFRRNLLLPQTFFKVSTDSTQFCCYYSFQFFCNVYGCRVYLSFKISRLKRVTRRQIGRACWRGIQYTSLYPFVWTRSFQVVYYAGIIFKSTILLKNVILLQQSKAWKVTISFHVSVALNRDLYVVTKWAFYSFF